VRAGLVEQAVDRAPVELPFDRLDQFPGCRREDRVEPELAEQRPELLQIFQVGCSRVAELAAEDQERRAVDDELLSRALGTEMRNVFRGWCVGGSCCQHERWQQPLAECAGGQNVPRKPTSTDLPDSNQLYVALVNCEYVRRSSSLMLITSIVNCGTHEEIPNISEKSKLDEKSHCV
jgi:hypothetical protein